MAGVFACQRCSALIRTRGTTCGLGEGINARVYQVEDERSLRRLDLYRPCVTAPTIVPCR